ncbi:MAG: hypothetical protein AB8G17_10110 [Gammaproteobacteria bacterium]
MWRNIVFGLSLILLAFTWWLPAVDIPDRTLNGLELMRLCFSSGIERLAGHGTLETRLLGGVLLLAVSSNIVVPVTCALRRRVPINAVAALSVVVLAASAYLTLRAHGQSAIGLRAGVALWYAAMAGMLLSRIAR